MTLRYCDGEKRTVTLMRDEFSKLLHNGSIRGEENGIAARILAAREALVRRAGDKALRAAVERYRILREYRETGIVPAGLSRRSLERFERWAREGERQYGGEFFGLIRLRGRTPGTPELDSGYQAVLAETVQEYRDNAGGAGYSVFYREFRRKCKKLVLYPVPSYSTLRRWLKKSRLWDLLFHREGWHSAYRVMGPTRKLEDEPAVPARVFETAHLDHTPLSVKVVSTYTGKVLESRVSLTFLTDAYCGLPLATYLSFDHPSKVAVCEVLHDCLARHARLPDSIVVDKGAEFGSADWEKALVMLDVVKVQRPGSSPRVGSPIERNFGITDSEFIHALPGSMRLAKPGRQQSSSHAPAKFAKLTFAQLQQGCEKWFFEVFPELDHGELGATRREAFEYSLEHSGERVSRYVQLDDGVRIALALSVSGDTRRVHPVRGIRVQWLDYWNDLFSYGDVAGTNVEVKVDPLDVSVVFARVRGEWVNCRISNGRAHLIGKSWKLVNLAIKELQEQRRTGAKRRWVNSEKVAELIKEVTGQDRPLARQAELDRESGRGADTEVANKGRPPLRLVRNENPDLGWLDGTEHIDPDSVPDDDDGLAGAEPYDVIR